LQALFQTSQHIYEKREGSGRPKNIRIPNTATNLKLMLFADKQMSKNKKGEEAGHGAELERGFGAPPAYSSSPQAGPAMPPQVGVRSKFVPLTS
jgi:hypothetical protein